MTNKKKPRKAGRAATVIPNPRITAVVCRLGEDSGDRLASLCALLLAVAGNPPMFPRE